MDDVLLARLIAAGRMLFGGACIAAPRLILGKWAEGATGPVLWMVRVFGIRDMVLGAGTLASLNSNTPDSSWVTFSAVADSADAALAIAFRDELGPAFTAATLSLAVPASALGWKAAFGLRRHG